MHERISATWLGYRIIRQTEVGMASVTGYRGDSYGDQTNTVDRCSRQLSVVAAAAAVVTVSAALVNTCRSLMVLFICRTV